MIESGVANVTQGVAIRWLQDGRRFVQALLVEVEGSAPLPVGAMQAVEVVRQQTSELGGVAQINDSGVSRRRRRRDRRVDHRGRRRPCATHLSCGHSDSAIRWNRGG